MMQLDAIGIISQNMEKSAEFYGLLGISFEQVGGPDHWEGITSSGVRIMLDSEKLMKQLDPNWQRTTGVAMVLCFKQETPAQVDERFAQITQAGFTHKTEPWDAFWGQRYASVMDPDGNQIDLFAALPQ
ncbi:VOC family protein [Magnetococcus sp. PR-3]|uniref:VOC family protein n=1 Tax=Magnetococcus sp. PR-3 TaxID=3120355 RepID=UPI002FCE1C22